MKTTLIAVVKWLYLLSSGCCFALFAPERTRRRRRSGLLAEWRCDTTHELFSTERSKMMNLLESGDLILDSSIYIVGD